MSVQKIQDQGMPLAERSPAAQTTGKRLRLDRRQALGGGHSAGNGWGQVAEPLSFKALSTKEKSLMGISHDFLLYLPCPPPKAASSVALWGQQRRERTMALS